MASNGPSNGGKLPFSKIDVDEQHDLMEAGKQVFDDGVDAEVDVDASSEDPFDITNTKNAPPETLRRWRVNL